VIDALTNLLFTKENASRLVLLDMSKGMESASHVVIRDAVSVMEMTSISVCHADKAIF
jgi:hypothetical protein